MNKKRTAAPYAVQTRNALSKRAKDTSEVTNILSGTGYHNTKPAYVSKPDIKKTQMQHQFLSHDYDEEFYEKEYGKKQNLRHLDPEMKVILAWGEFDPPVKNDFTSTKGAFTEKYKINKMGVDYITEKQDNYRDHLANKKISKEQQIVDYLQGENQEKIKAKIYRNQIEKELMKDFTTFTTEYREQMRKNATMEVNTLSEEAK